MPVREICLFPDPVLRQVCQPIIHFDTNLQKLLSDMRDTMRRQPHGIGIAAPQIGKPVQCALIDVSARVPGASLKCLINPKILELQNPKASREGCMSLPDYMGNIKRYDWVRITWQDECGRKQAGEFTGIEAVCIQHEIDHLTGVLFMDRAASLKRDMIPRVKGSKHS